MYDAAEFRKRAEHCVRQANAPGRLQTEKATLLRMAGKWLALADDAERVRALISDALSCRHSESFDRDFVGGFRFGPGPRGAQEF
jgi:hypothetical protein